MTHDMTNREWTREMERQKREAQNDLFSRLSPEWTQWSVSPGFGTMEFYGNADGGTPIVVKGCYLTPMKRPGP